VLLVGYIGNYYIVRNSWSADWGQAGYFLMAKAYLENPDLASDFWTVRQTYQGA